MRYHMRETARKKERRIGMKRRIASILLAVMMIVALLPLGLVDTAWAAESSAITARVKEYIYACQSFKNANNASNVYWNALQCSTKGMSSAQRKQGMVTLKNHADQKNYQADLTTTPCKVPNNNTSLHNYSTNHHCDSNYFSGIDKGYGQCQGFTDYMAYVLFGEEGTKVSNFETIQTSTPYSFAYQPGDIVRVNGHSFLVYEGTGTGATIIECNMRGAEKSAFCVLRWNRTVKNDLDVLNTSGGARILRPKASLTVTGTQHICNQGSFMYVWKAHPHYRCYRCSICGNVWTNTSEPTLVATCDSCRPGKPTLVNMQSSYASNQSVTFTWYGTANTTHYNLCLQRANNNGGWETVEYISYAGSGLTRMLSTGNYRAQLISYNSNLRETDNSDWVHTQSDDCYFSVVILVPSAPMVKIGNSTSSGKPQLTWDAVSGADSYNVYRAVSGEGAYTKINSTTATSYVNTGAKEGVTYYYKITAVNSSGEGEFSNIVSGQVKTMTQQKPSAPVVRIGNSAASGKPMLTWNAVEGATSYRIYRSTSKGSGYSLLGTTTATSYTNTGAKAGTTYYYRVKACSDAGLSPYSNIVSGQAKSVTPKLSAPVVKIGHSASSGKPMLTWNAVSGATSYKVYRAASQNGTYSLLGTVTATSYTNTGAKAGTTYWYKVKAVNTAGESAYSNIVSGWATVTTLTLGHSSTSGKPQLTWKAVSGAASYKVYRATSKNGAYSVINTTKALTYTNTGAALGTTYYYKVEALNAAGKSMGFSAVVEGKVAPVLAVGYSSVSGKPQLTWKAVPGATEYQVYRSTQQNSGYSKINTTTATSYVNTGAKANMTYYYRIVALKGTAVSDFSNIASARPGK